MAIISKSLCAQGLTAGSKVKGLNPDYVDEVNGGKRLVFRDANGVVISNPTNLAPYTAAELLGNVVRI